MFTIIRSRAGSMCRAVSISILLLFTAATAAAAGDSPIVIENAFARASATPVAKAGVAYFTIMNHGPADKLLGAHSEASKRAMLHTTEKQDGVLKMVHQSNVEVPMHDTVIFEPGGLHVMLMGLKAPLKEGEMLAITLRFEKAGDIEIMVPIGGVAAESAGTHSDHSGHGHSD